MSERGLYIGQALQGIDAKGRVGIPAALRTTLETNGKGRILFLGVNRTGTCLTGADPGQSRIDYDKLLKDEERALDAGQDMDVNAVARRMFGKTEELPFDASGRFIIPPFYRHKAGLTDQAYFVGVAARFEIWNPDRMLSDPDVDPGDKEVLEFLRASKGTA